VPVLCNPWSLVGMFHGCTCARATDACAVQLWSSPVVAVLFLAWALSEVSDAAHFPTLRLTTLVLTPSSAHK